MPSESVSVLHEGPYTEEAVRDAAGRIRSGLSGPATIAFAFVTPDYLPYLADFSDTIRVDGHVLELVGCTGSGLTSDGLEREVGTEEIRAADSSGFQQGDGAAVPFLLLGSR